MGLGPIPRSAIMSYADESGLWGDSADNFATIIRMVDTEYLRLSNSTDKDYPKHEEVAVTDVEGTKQVLNRLVARAGSVKKSKDRNGKS